MNEILNVSDITKVYGKKDNVTYALNGISFKVNKGEFIGIMGPSGSGKSTLLNCISTIDTTTSGNILIENNDITSLNKKMLSAFRREKLGFVFQQFNLIDTLTAYENIALSLSITKLQSNKINERVTEIAKVLEIEEVLTKFPYQMSGGQQQRVSAARAIVGKPSLILADEPTGALDSKSAKKFLENIDIMNEEMKATILMVTHDTFTASYCKRILFIKDGIIIKELHRGEDSRTSFYERIMAETLEVGGQ
jgi:putative ABC transport system ATP-binding protein